MTRRISKAEAAAFRLHAHGLDERSPAPGLLEAAGRCGIQDSPPGSALLALHARVRTTAEQVQRAIAEERSLMRTWSMRGAPFCFPVTDAAVFTTGVLPPSEAAMRHLLPGAEPALDGLGMGLGEAVDLVDRELRQVLPGRRLAINELGAEVAERIAPELPAEQRHRWVAEGPYATGQSLGEGVVHFCIRILTLRGVICFAARAGTSAPFVLVQEWLGAPIPDVNPEQARAELLRRYLRCYGPSTRADFAAWIGIRAGDTDPWWTLLADEVLQVDFDRTAWILAADLDALRSSSMPTGLRLLPPGDPYTQLRDRATIVDPRHQREVWKPVGGPGTVLCDGRIVGTWRHRKQGRTLAITLRLFGSLPERLLPLLQQEAHQVARLRGASHADIALATR